MGTKRRYKTKRRVKVKNTKRKSKRKRSSRKQKGGMELAAAAGAAGAAAVIGAGVAAHRRRKNRTTVNQSGQSSRPVESRSKSPSGVHVVQAAAKDDVITLSPAGTVLPVDTKKTTVFAKKIKDTSEDTGIQLGGDHWWRCSNIDAEPGKHYAIITIHEKAKVRHIGESLFSTYDRPYFVMDEDGWIWSNFPDDCWKKDERKPKHLAVRILQVLFEKNKGSQKWYVSDIVIPPESEP